MKLSVWTSYYIELSPEEALAELKKHGINYTELSDEHGEMLLRRGDAKTVGKEFGEYAKSIGMEISQGHLWLRCRICTVENALDILMGWIDLYEAIGVKNAVLHCDVLGDRPELTEDEKYEENIRVLKQVAERLKGRKIKICLENLLGFAESSSDLLRIVNALDSENFGICLDTGHLNIARHRGLNETQREFMLACKEHLSALHIADNEGERDQHMMPFGRGNVDFREVMTTAREIGYDGLFNYEIPGESHGKPTEVKGYKLDYVKRCFEYMEREY